MSICGVVNCESKMHGKGLCNKHYKRLYYTGRLDLKTIEDRERFEEKIHTIPECGCWLFIGANVHNYGLFSIKGRHVLAHRFSWKLYNGEIPRGLNVLHKCDTPECCNPHHLFLGTISDNNKDMVRKGRHAKTHPNARGELHGGVKLTTEQVLYIKKSDEMNIALAKKYNVSDVQISNIKKNKQWKHINP